MQGWCSLQSKWIIESVSGCRLRSSPLCMFRRIRFESSENRKTQNTFHVSPFHAGGFRHVKRKRRKHVSCQDQQLWKHHLDCCRWNCNIRRHVADYAIVVYCWLYWNKSFKPCATLSGGILDPGQQCQGPKRPVKMTCRSEEKCKMQWSWVLVFFLWIYIWYIYIYIIYIYIYVRGTSLPYFVITSRNTII